MKPIVVHCHMVSGRALRRFKKPTWFAGQEGMPPRSQLKHAASLLKAAAGVNVVSPGSQPVENSLLPALNTTEIYPGIHVANESHADALKTLSFLYSQGQREFLGC